MYAPQRKLPKRIQNFADPMTPKARLLSTLSGKPVDRTAVFTQIPFSLSESGFLPGPFHGYTDYDDWRSQDPAYVKLVKRMEDECDNFFIWRPPCMQNSQFLLSPTLAEKTVTKGNDGKIYYKTVFSYNDLTFQEILAKQPGAGHSWQIEHLCKTPEDAKALLSLPWTGNLVGAGDFFNLQTTLGNRGLMWVTVPSPIQVVCRLFDPNEFLILTRLETVLINQLMETAAERIYDNLQKLLELGVGPIIRFGGAEHATPPLMSPADFDWLVVRFDTPLVNLCKKYGKMVAYHCHGKITHALHRFIEMGVDMIDPVETVPDGDMTLEQAKSITGNAITLIGNIQMKDIANAAPHEIQQKVKKIIDTLGPGHLILSTTGTPLEKMDSRTEENYHAFIDAVLCYST
ncbi:MAG: hypothetical protein HQ557_07250 [Bacteroidetes bacterium]|nr:hypothetical protein [Bacteroidota bacterium]